MQRQGWTRIVVCAGILLALVGLAVPSLPSASFRAAAQGDGTGGAAPAAATSVASPAAASPVASPAASPAAATAATPVAQPVPSAEPPVFASGRWRITVVVAQRAAEFPTLDLPVREGRDWIVVVADVANWSTKRATFEPAEFGVRVAGVERASGFSTDLSEKAADQLSLQPTDVAKGVGISSGKSARFVLVFRMDSTAADPILAYGADELPLSGAILRGGSIDAAPEAAPLPALSEASVEEAVDGATLKLEGADVRLAGVDAPTGSDCFAGQAKRRLERLAGGKVLVEQGGDPANAFVWAQDKDGLRTMLNREVIAGGTAAVAGDVAGPYAAWLRDADATARRDLNGLWATCTSQHGVGRNLDPQVTSLKVRSDGDERAYAVWVAWSPLLATKPDGSAWAFFSAEPNAGGDKGNKRLYASRYDPATGTWSTATAMKGGKVQMGPAAAVDADGIVHLVFINRAEDKDGVFSEIFYAREDGNGGWTEPVPVAREATSGYQLSPSLAIDKNGTLHVAWQDQRAFTKAERGESASNADIFVSELPPGKTAWSKPVLISTHYVDAVSSRPHIVADGDRLVAVWSVYADALGLNTAIRVDWSTRPLDDELAWSAPEPLVVGRGESFGGRLLDLAADPTGGVVFVYGRQATDTFLFLRRLAPGATEWGGDTLLTYGDRGTFPSVTVSDQGVVYVVYNAGNDGSVDVGGVAIPYRSIQPGPEVILTTDQDNTQGRPIVATDVTGRPWIVYFSEPPDGPADDVRVLRNAQIPDTATADDGER